ncbi:hypothetical protein CTheo_9152 [Ceratobasidium theobromae]|uniref:Uncharacterized protein n=1 Tax=Ceratobasidium theobromae TaxID=1582974 RepID=A0A5N5Q619_9AGAM|nr:hypothetical protein CTheo_9152 [Ceratobasidium theobromae]
MGQAKPSDPESPIPPFALKSANAAREQELETQLFRLTNNNVVLSDNDLAAMRKELDQYRENKRLATLVNGNHRIHAMIRASDKLRIAAEQIALMARRDEEADYESMWSHLNKQVAKMTYVVEVYKDTIPPHVLIWLAKNQESRPNQAPRAGERLWALAEAQERTIADWIAQKTVPDRIAGLNRWHKERESALAEREDPLTNPTGAGASEPAAKGRKKPAKVKISGQLSETACHQLMAHPVLNEMVVDTHALLWVLNNIMHDSYTEKMRRDYAGPYELTKL